MALADSYSAYALAAAPPPLAGPTSAELAHYFHRYQTLGPPPCSPLTRYLPAGPCGGGLASSDWRLARESSHRSVVDLSPTSAMHDDRNPLPLAAAEAAASNSASAVNVSSGSTTSGSSGTTLKVEAGSTGDHHHPMSASSSVARNFCQFPVPMMGSVAAAYRCLNANCSCAGQSSPSCPKNVQAGPLTGQFFKKKILKFYSNFMGVV